MKKILLISITIILFSCSAGDIDIKDFDFADVELQDCGDLVLYKVKDNEALFIELANVDREDFYITEKTYPLSENGANTITYRTFDETLNGSNYFCQSIPPTGPATINEWTGEEGALIVNVGDPTLDDNDGVPTGIEDIDGDGDPENDDKDRDGFPNYIDLDDDGDGVATIDEDIDGDGDPTNDDTDGDSIPNYLDEDDDDDDVDTIRESITGDEDEDGVADYLDDDTTNELETDNTLVNRYTKTYAVVITVAPLRLSNSDGDFIQYESYLLYEEDTYTITEIENSEE